MYTFNLSDKFPEVNKQFYEALRENKNGGTIIETKDTIYFFGNFSKEFMEEYTKQINNARRS